MLRGYERRQVDAYIDQLHACLDELRRSPDARVTPPPAQFTIVLRGYDPQQVHTYCDRLLARITAANPGGVS